MQPFNQSHKTLLQWYNKEGRHNLPWRNTTNIYHIYLSEIMLQQTQVNRVQEFYYPKFLKLFPTLQMLSQATQEEVLSAWSGLGYYSRARNLHKTAQLLDKRLPNSIKELKKLPGIGEYTASAICSFGFEQPVCVVDTNIARVIKRFFALISPTAFNLRSQATIFLNQEFTRAHNLALMDLGSLICLPKNPNCKECPLSSQCLGKNEPEFYTKKIKKEYINMDLFLGVFIQNNKIALQVSKKNMYKNMLVLPSIEPLDEKFLGVFKHSYTKYRLDVYLYKFSAPKEKFVWLDLDKFDEAPISSLTKKARTFFTLNQ